ncbi:MAG TPA: UDP-3-O-(3-hydroxymyristoyl)glucosamine N-acyltransferase [Chitinophagales bacterium]|nr:UDP-3-O-(3-hydroxymyristoyl)glucosamine N-acyltransferase [Chitinophagales bacterium]HMZ90386.1 UDP-3-O-(3-hydroxymyristoyl)glucosamine N-acyltransferase [Chitinophagales bacterium]HNA59333.1 UDP-3-O-(3-hydroxymyristoyl)glucosamine N-acyltransferase [Chitinophagales bacterium]HNE46598.1 UDP-3-O-(3-hydroxymyristoyl)glucosamine N-acyltransferase [Chitinophagales bacterium]HNF68988.1 UDP-3-O-(3-hydroxymyristoyl)glucosamine N-acyltransferase [Chitinophagales bacterium]
MEFTARELCDFLQGTLEGDPSIKVRKPARIEEGQPGDVCFLANPKYLSFAYTTAASVLIVNADQVFEQPVKSTLIRVKDAYTAIAKVLDQYQNMQRESAAANHKVESNAIVSPSAKIGAKVHVGSFSTISEDVVVGDNSIIHAQVYLGKRVKIGANTCIFPGVIVLDECVIGDNCIIGAGTVIGSDGFGFAPQADGTYKKVAQTGNVVIEDMVEIGANTTIDRATMGSTIIRKGAKLDNLIQIAHNVEIGENTVIAAQSGISGSTKIGKNCVIGGQVGIVGHITIADGTKINAQSGVSKSVKEPDQALTGSPAFEYSAGMRSQVLFRKLPELMDRIKLLEEKISQLENKQ